MQSSVMSQCNYNGCAPPDGKRACLAFLLYGHRESVDAAAERCDVRERTITLKHWNDSSPRVTSPPTPPPVCVVAWFPEHCGMQASARPRSISPRAAAWPRYLLQWVDQEPILFVAQKGISASNLRSADSSKASFLFEQTDPCFSLWWFVCHTNWLCLFLAVTLLSR